MNSKRSFILLVAIGFSLSACRSVRETGSGQLAHQFRFTHDMDALTVPAGRCWRIGGLKPYESEYEAGTADLYIDGYIFIGSKAAYTINGKFDVCIDTKQTSPIWILENSKVQVGDSRGSLVVEEFINPAGESYPSGR